MRNVIKMNFSNYFRFKYQEVGLGMPTIPPPTQNLSEWADFIRSDHARYTGFSASIAATL